MEVTCEAGLHGDGWHLEAYAGVYWCKYNLGGETAQAGTIVTRAFRPVDAPKEVSDPCPEVGQLFQARRLDPS